MANGFGCLTLQNAFQQCQQISRDFTAEEHDLKNLVDKKNNIVRFESNIEPLKQTIFQQFSIRSVIKGGFSQLEYRGNLIYQFKWSH